MLAEEGMANLLDSDVSLSLSLFLSHIILIIFIGGTSITG